VNDGSRPPSGSQEQEVTDVHYRLEVRITPADVGQRVVIRWRRPGPPGDEPIVDVLGLLEDAGAGSFAVRTAAGELVIVPAGRALAGKVVPPPPARPRRT
jgi:N-acetylglutamate synthase